MSGTRRYVIHEAHGHYFSRYPIGGPLLVSPLYFPFAFIGLRDWDPGSLVMFARIAEKFTATADRRALRRFTSAPVEANHHHALGLVPDIGLRFGHRNLVDFEPGAVAAWAG